MQVLRTRHDTSFAREQVGIEQPSVHVLHMVSSSPSLPSSRSSEFPPRATTSAPVTPSTPAASPANTATPRIPPAPATPETLDARYLGTGVAVSPLHAQLQVREDFTLRVSSVQAVALQLCPLGALTPRDSFPATEPVRTGDIGEPACQPGLRSSVQRSVRRAFDASWLREPADAHIWSLPGAARLPGDAATRSSDLPAVTGFAHRGASGDAVHTLRAAREPSGTHRSGWCASAPHSHASRIVYHPAAPGTQMPDILHIAHEL